LTLQEFKEEFGFKNDKQEDSEILFVKYKIELIVKSQLELDKRQKEAKTARYCDTIDINNRALRAPDPIE